jgi:small-conductance mechanosensitive channel/CRP-like cAMP-binding protein
MVSIDSLHASGGYLLVGVLLFAALLWVLARAERTRILITASIFCLAFVVSLLSKAAPAASLGSILHGLSVLAAGIVILSLLGIALFRVALPAVGLASPRILQEVAVALVQLFWAFVLLRMLGWDPTAVVATSAVATAVVAFSLQDTLGNILGGLAIELERSIRVGDWIKVDDVVGRLAEIRWRHAAVETRNWETVIIPNSLLVKNKVVILGRRAGQPVQWRRWVWFNVDFRQSPAKVIETVEGAIRTADIARVARTPPPNCVQMDFAEGYARYAVRYWLTDLAADDPTDSEVRSHIYFALSRAGITPSIPVQSVLVTKETAKRRALQTERALVRRVEALRHEDIFSSLQREELTQLAQHLVPAPFATGDVMTRQGATGHWLYIINSGHADVVVEGSDDRSTRVAELGPGSFFGEWSLLTGEPRHATVIARTAVDCYRLDKESFQGILQARPAIADEISAVLARRRTELDATLENLDAEARARRLAQAHTDILGRIRSFFRLED